MFHIDIEGNVGGLLGGKGVLAPLQNYWDLPHPLPTPMHNVINLRFSRLVVGSWSLTALSDNISVYIE